ncbi:hypothetical protein PARMER_00602 [Parabacteroides merdae ATCC 43184]|nr:hypothetical protein PARMER_00602 [Parabacteroides merdae ATCC 43184]
MVQSFLNSFFLLILLRRRKGEYCLFRYIKKRGGYAHFAFPPLLCVSRISRSIFLSS